MEKLIANNNFQFWFMLRMLIISKFNERVAGIICVTSLYQHYTVYMICCVNSSAKRRVVRPANKKKRAFHMRRSLLFALWKANRQRPYFNEMWRGMESVRVHLTLLFAAHSAQSVCVCARGRLKCEIACALNNWCRKPEHTHQMKCACSQSPRIHNMNKSLL